MVLKVIVFHGESGGLKPTESNPTRKWASALGLALLQAKALSELPFYPRPKASALSVFNHR
jgi:hypothetical protein